MDKPAEVLLLIFFLVFALFIVFLFFTAVFQGLVEMLLAFYHHKIRWRTPISRSRYEEINGVLERYISYYRKLSWKGRARFVNRLVNFLSTKQFTGKEGLNVTDEMKILIASAAVTLTYGLDKYILAHYTNILVYPQKFYSEELQANLKGATFGNHIIALSWKDIVRGFSNPHDKFNLGLHEMAHALKLDAVLGTDADDHFSRQLDKWQEAGFEEFNKLQGGSPSFFRRYGGTNKHEFFAVCVEHFFEVPEHFQHSLPDLYRELCILLNQDPANEAGDYRLEE